MKNLKKIIAFMLVLGMVLISVQTIGSIKVQAKSEKTWYETWMSGTKDGIKKMKLKGNKLTIWGSFTKASSNEELANGEGKKLKYKKRTFTLSKKVKFIATGGDVGEETYSRELFEECYVPNPSMGLGFRMVVKNGKVVKIYTDS